MKRIPEQIEAMLAPVVEGLGYEWVGAEFRGGADGMLRVFIDQPGKGIGIEDCERVSLAISGVLDVEDPFPGQYVLEVSSPGLDRPLFRPEHFERFSGETARVRLLRPIERRKKLQGVIRAVDEDAVTLEVDGELVSLHFADIDKANLVFDYQQGSGARGGASEANTQDE
ncbi:MAG: ribosome maturation factor RimP [Guyparkeria sp.]